MAMGDSHGAQPLQSFVPVGPPLVLDRGSWLCSIQVINSLDLKTQQEAGEVCGGGMGPKGLLRELILLMAEILHQLRLVVYPIIYRVLYTQGGAGFCPSTVSLILH